MSATEALTEKAEKEKEAEVEDSVASSGHSPEESGDESNANSPSASKGQPSMAKQIAAKKLKAATSNSDAAEVKVDSLHQASNLLQVLDKNSQNAVNNAAKELRRNYAKKVADKLAFLTKTSLKTLSKHFASASSGESSTTSDPTQPNDQEVKTRHVHRDRKAVICTHVILLISSLHVINQ